MLFSSYEFLLLYLPITLGGFFFLARHGHRLAAQWLAAASLFFYGWWSAPFVLLLLGSITVNYGFGATLSRMPAGTRKQFVLAAALVINLCVLFFFKYTNFFIDTANHAFGWKMALAHIVLPLGISFFTFTQIAFLVDVYRGLVHEYRFIHYVLFVTYFPHLIAGPVLHHSQMMPQFAAARTYVFSADNLVQGLSILAIGLAKKVLLADSLAEYANPVFDGARDGSSPLFLTAWSGALAYTLQLYFDFSGYSDMAIGLSCMFGVKLPLNFASPYKASSIIEFWRRWHMSLSQFLRDYLYVPLGGNRKGTVWRHFNLMVTMILGGLWHGANWTFVVWGTLHGLFLVTNHLWNASRPKTADAKAAPRLLRTISSTLLTFLCVTGAWVVFRAETFDAARSVFAGMLGRNGVSLPGRLDHEMLSALGWKFAGVFPDNDKLNALGSTPLIGLIALGLCIVWLLPNTQQIFGYTGPSDEAGAAASKAGSGVFVPSLASAVLLGLLFGLSLMSFSKASPFLYFQF